MLKAAAAKKQQHDKALKHKPTNEKDWKLMNQINQAPNIYNKRVANMELRRLFLEGKNIRNNASEKQRLQGILNSHNISYLQAGRYRRPSRVERQAFEDRVAQLDRNPANRSYSQQNPTMAPIIGAQPHYTII
jgi:hypothetical protein